MKNALLIFISIGIIATLSACRTDAEGSTGSSPDSTLVISESTLEPTSQPTSIPTYAPGTELYGMLSVTGEVVVEPKYEYLDLFSDEGLARFCDHGRWGFVNTDGDEVIPAQYEDANNFSEGLAVVKVDGLYGFIDKSGTMVIEPQYEEIFGNFQFGRCVFSKNELKGLIDSTGETILEPSYADISITSRKYFVASNGNDKHGIIDSDGKSVVACQYPEIITVTEAGCFFIQRANYLTSRIQFDMYDIYGKSYVGYQDYSYILGEDNSSVKFLAISSDGENWGLFDIHKGDFIISPIFEYLYYLDGTKYALVDSGNGVGVYDLTTGIITENVDTSGGYGVEYDLIIYVEDGKQGVKNPDGTIVLEAKYDQVSCSPHGVFAAGINGKYSLIDSNGKTLREYTNRVVYGYIESLDCWQFFYKESLDEWNIDGFISRNGDEVRELNCYPYDVNCPWSDFMQYTEPMDLSRSPAIFNDLPCPGTENNTDCPGIFGILNSFNQSDYVLYQAYSWFPEQGIIVVTDVEENYGVVSNKGDVLFELCDCKILTNENDEGLIREYKYNKYNDTDYLVFVVEAK